MTSSVLLVEDDPNDLLIEGRLLHKLGLEVSNAGTVAQARAMVIARLGSSRPVPFDLALVDLRLVGSDGDGLDVIRYLREVCPRVPVVMVSGSIAPASLRALESLGHVYLAWKPLTSATITMMLDHYKIAYKRTP